MIETYGIGGGVAQVHYVHGPFGFAYFMWPQEGHEQRLACCPLNAERPWRSISAKTFDLDDASIQFVDDWVEPIPPELRGTLIVALTAAWLCPHADLCVVKNDNTDTPEFLIALGFDDFAIYDPYRGADCRFPADPAQFALTEDCASILRAHNGCGG